MKVSWDGITDKSAQLWELFIVIDDDNWKDRSIVIFVERSRKIDRWIEKERKRLTVKK